MDIHTRDILLYKDIEALQNDMDVREKLALPLIRVRLLLMQLFQIAISRT